MFDPTKLAQLIVPSVKTGTFQLASGRTTNYYIDLASLAKTQEGLALMSAGIARLLVDVDCVGGPSTGADALVYALLLHRPGLKAFLVHSPRIGGILHGFVWPGARCLVVEDVTTSGGSVLNACAKVVAQGGIVSHVVSVVDRKEGAREAINQAGYPFTSLLLAEEVLRARDHVVSL